MRRFVRIPQRLELVIFVVIGSIGSIVSAQQTPARPAPAPMANFTGNVASLDASDLRTVRFKYEAGTRSYWHVHDGTQILMLEEGRGRMQLQGQPVKELVPGQPVMLPANVPHWHGAAPDQGLTWISVSIGGVKWMNPVTEQEYNGK